MGTCYLLGKPNKFAGERRYRNSGGGDNQLEQREGHPSPVIIDFGKSVLAEKAKVPRAKPKHVSGEFSYIFDASSMVWTQKTSVVLMSQCYVIKQMVNAIACTIELWMHL